MKNIHIRSAFISIAAICGAMIWGMVEFLALQWTRLEEKLRAAKGIRAH